MKTEKMKVLLYLKKSGIGKSGKAPIMGRITLGRSIAQFSCKLSCNPDLWNSRESRMDGKSCEAVEINGRLENLLLSIQSAYQSFIAKGRPFESKLSWNSLALSLPIKIKAYENRENEGAALP